jgi:hypothetical protein
MLGVRVHRLVMPGPLKRPRPLEPATTDRRRAVFASRTDFRTHLISATAPSKASAHSRRRFCASPQGAPLPATNEHARH